MQCVQCFGGLVGGGGVGAGWGQGGVSEVRLLNDTVCQYFMFLNMMTTVIHACERS